MEYPVGDRRAARAGARLGRPLRGAAATVRGASLRLRRILGDACVVEPEPHEDERGTFARVFDAERFAREGLEAAVAQCAISHNRRRWTIRGLHYQAAPHQEAKLVRCVRGAVYDVVVDLREDSPTFGTWAAVELSADNRLAVHVPRGYAHGFQTLTDDAELYYHLSVPYVAEAQSGVRWDDPTIGIRWPAPPSIVSERDARLPHLRRAEDGR